MKFTVIPIVIVTLDSHLKIGSRTGGLGNKRTQGDHPNFCRVEIHQDTEKSPGDFTQTPVENHQLTPA